MKGKIIESKSWSDFLPLFLGSLYLFMIISWVMARVLWVSDTVSVICSILDSEPGIEYEVVGQTSTHHLISITIGVNKQKYSLTKFVTTLYSYGCDLQSTTNSEHPSFRELVIHVPKISSSFITSRSVMMMGCVSGFILFIYSNTTPNTYNILSNQIAQWVNGIKATEVF